MSQKALVVPPILFHGCSYYRFKTQTENHGFYNPFKPLYFDVTPDPCERWAKWHTEKDFTFNTRFFHWSKEEFVKWRKGVVLQVKVEHPEWFVYENCFGKMQWALLPEHRIEPKDIDLIREIQF